MARRSEARWGRMLGGGVLAMALAALAGCGGGGSGATLDVQAFEACIGHNFSPETPLTTNSEEGLDLIAENAGVGAVQVTSEKNEIQVVGERTEGDAEDTESEYAAFGLGQVERIGTVVLAYNKSPIPQESEPIKHCLSEHGIE